MANHTEPESSKRDPQGTSSANIVLDESVAVERPLGSLSGAVFGRFARSGFGNRGDRVR
jgi:hypothetical protein